jgi:hypothetical protein
MLRISLLIIAALTALLLGPETSYGRIAAPNALRTVAYAGDAAPGAGAGVVFRDFGNATLNDAGVVAFRGRLAGPGTSDNSSWSAWSEGGGALHLLARSGQPAPFGGAFSDNIVTPQLNNVGQSLFWADIAGGTLYLEHNGTFTRLAGPGMQAAGAPAGVTYRPIWAGHPTFPVNDLGQYAFVTALTGPGVVDGNRHGLWLGTGVAHQLVARAGDPAPDTEPGTVFITSSSDAFAPTPALTPDGKIAFTTRMNGPNAPANGTLGIWIGTPGNLNLAVRSGAQPPGGPAGSFISDFGAPVVNEAGDVAINAAVFGSGGGGFSDRGIYVHRDGALDEVVRRGQPAAGAGGAAYLEVGLPVINGSGDVAFSATITGSHRGMWKEKNRVIEPVILPTEDVPGGTPGERLVNFDESLINDRGQVAFMGETNFGRVGVWAEDISGVLQKIVMEGETIEFRPGQFGEVTSIGFDTIIGYAGSQDGRASSFNTKGQIAFQAEVDGRAGVFVSDLVVPEPSTFTLAALGVVIVVRWRVRRGAVSPDKRKARSRPTRHQGQAI